MVKDKRVTPTFTQAQIDFLKDGINNPLTLLQFLAEYKKELSEDQKMAVGDGVEKIVTFLDELKKK